MTTTTDYRDSFAAWAAADEVADAAAEATIRLEDLLKTERAVPLEPVALVASDKHADARRATVVVAGVIGLRLANPPLLERLVLFHALERLEGRRRRPKAVQRHLGGPR